VAQQQEPRNYVGSTLQQGSVLESVAQHLGVRQNPDLKQAILTQWYDLLRTGYFARGVNLSNPNPQIRHTTGTQPIEPINIYPGLPLLGLIDRLQDGWERSSSVKAGC